MRRIASLVLGLLCLLLLLLCSSVNAVAKGSRFFVTPTARPEKDEKPQGNQPLTGQNEDDGSNSSSGKSQGETGTKSPSQPHAPRLKPRVVSLNIMVAGLAGLGKTTTCTALIEAWQGKAQPSNGKKQKPKSTTMIDTSRVYERFDAESNTILRVCIVDTPGFGNRVDHRHAVHPIAKYIAKCRDRQYRAEMSKSGLSPDAGTSLVHVCLYFIAPGRFLEMDRHFLKQIQKEVAIVPLIAKADTLTDDEIAIYRSELLDTFEREKILIYDFDVDHTRHAVRFQRGRRRGEPLAIISRHGFYPWGESHAFLPEHSDLILIRDLLLSEHTERLVDVAERRYANYRSNRIGNQRLLGYTRYLVLGLLFFNTVRTSIFLRGECPDGESGLWSSPFLKQILSKLQKFATGFTKPSNPIEPKDATPQDAPRVEIIKQEEPLVEPVPSKKQSFLGFLGGGWFFDVDDMTENRQE